MTSLVFQTFWHVYQTAVSNKITTNRTMSSLSFNQGELQHSNLKATCHPTLYGMDHFFGFEMPGAKSPRMKPSPFSYAPGEGSFNIVCPNTRSLKCEQDKKTLACFNRKDVWENFEKRTASPFDTGKYKITGWQ